MELLGPLFAKLIQRSGLTNAEIAKAAGFSPTIIPKITGGNRGIRTKHARSWCVALNLNKEDSLLLTKAIHLRQASAELRAWIADLERRSGMSI